MPRPKETRQGNDVPETDVAAMFDSIAPVYDRVNTLMTAGGDGRWRRAAAEATELRSGQAAIDAACGTGKLSATLAARVGPFGRVVGVDLAPAMIAAAQAGYPDLVQLSFQVGNALTLPFADAEFDAATIAFGLRNLADFEAGFRELARVVRPGGRVVCLELSVPPQRGWGRIFRGAFGRLAPLVAGAFGQGRTYRYLPTSLDGFPDPDTLAATMRAAGLLEVSFRRLALGAVALHVGRAPEVSRPGV
ncbi:MAG TPA: ubiquinone/menaquinone biosynthesis methyltransferase [Candidatus Limnocylindrales bacterium]|nr:ubiquinone/menaquinone biosynthesis methyltransferase [Candidatus Limnocylindrales bacterium]